MLGKQYRKLLSTLSSSDKALLKNVEGLAPETIEDDYVDVAIEVNPEIFLDLGLSNIGTKDDKDYIENDLGVFYAGENSEGKCWFWAFTQIDEDKAKTGDFSEEDIAGFGDGESGVIPENKETEQFKRFKEIIKPFVIQSIKDEYGANIEKGVQENMDTNKKKSSNSLKENKKSNNKQVKESCELDERNLTRAERHNRDMNRIFDGVKKQNDDMANFLRTKGISDEEIEEMKKNCGLHGNALRSKIAELGLDDEYFNKNKKESCKGKNCKEDLDKDEDENYGEYEGFLEVGDFIIFDTLDDELSDWEEEHPSDKGYEVVEIDREEDGTPTGMFWIKDCPVALDFSEDNVEKIDLGESCKESKKPIKETWAGEDVIDDLVDRAKSYMDEGYAEDDAINRAIDEGLIYTNDVRTLAIHYDTLPSDSELINEFIEQLYDDMYSQLGDYEPEGAESEDDDLEEESLQEDDKKESIKESLPTRKSSKKQAVKESVEDNSEVNKIAKFLKGCLEQGYDFEGTSWYDLDGDFSVSVGWLPGYDPEDANRDGSIVDENGYALCYEITECPNTYAYVDFESLLMPYNDETGDVYSVGSNFKKDDNCEEIAKYLLNEYEYIKQEFDNGELTID